jgi:hypothetical protein
MEQDANASGERRYAVVVDGGPATECDEHTLLIAWARVPDVSLRVRALAPNDEAVLFEFPEIRVRRLQ